MSGPITAAEPVSIPTPAAELTLETVIGLLRDHRREELWLHPWNDIWRPRALDGDPAALVSVLMMLAIEDLSIHALAEAEPHRPVAEILAQARQQLKGL